MANEDLLNDINNTFYGGGNAYPIATPTPTPSALPWYKRLFGAKTPTPSPSPTPNRFSMTDRINTGLGTALQYQLQASSPPRDSVQAAILSSRYMSPLSRLRSINGSQVMSTDNPVTSTVPVSQLPVPQDLMHRFMSRPDVSQIPFSF